MGHITLYPPHDFIRADYPNMYNGSIMRFQMHMDRNGSVKQGAFAFGINKVSESNSGHATCLSRLAVCKGQPSRYRL